MRTAAHLKTAILTLSLTACGVQTHYTPTNLPPRPMHPRSPESVLMFTSSAPTRPFVEVGLVTSAHASGYSTATDDDVILGVRKQAADIGCDGVVFQSETTSLVGSVQQGDVRTWNIKKFRAACIMFTDDQPAVAGS